MEAHDFNLFKLPLFARKLVNINVSRSAVPNMLLCQQAVITAMYSSQTSTSLPSFIRIEKGSDGSP